MNILIRFDYDVYFVTWAVKRSHTVVFHFNKETHFFLDGWNALSQIKLDFFLLIYGISCELNGVLINEPDKIFSIFYPHKWICCLYFSTSDQYLQWVGKVLLA